MMKVIMGLLCAFGLMFIGNKAEAQEPRDSYQLGTQWYHSYPLQQRGSKTRATRVEQTHERAVRYVRRGVERAAAVVGAIAQPSRYISGSLICARNVNAALEERGVKGTGSALARSFLSWGHSTTAHAGAVAFNWRRGGGHVSIVAKVDSDGTVWVWNPSPRGRGWQLRRNPYASVYRSAA